MTNRFGRSGQAAGRPLALGLLTWLASWTSTAFAQVPEPLARPEAAPPASGTIRDGFEGPKVIWRQEQTDAAYKIFAHERTKRAAHDGQLSEGFQFEAGIGGGLYYSYPLPKVPITDALKVSLYIRSNRSGAQILGRVVLPADVDPETRKPAFVLVPGTAYDTADRWRRVELDDMLPSIERQARVLRASSRRKVSLEGAYLERLVINLYGGEGDSEVYLDELAIGPVAPDLVAAHARMVDGEEGDRPGGPSALTIADRPRGANEPAEPSRPTAAGRIKLERNRLTKDGLSWFPTIARAPKADPRLLRQVGCDVAVVASDADEESIKVAIAEGLLLIVELNAGVAETQLPDPDRMLAEAAAFPFKDHVFAWSLGDDLGRTKDLKDRKAALRKVRDAVLLFRKARPGGTPFTIASVLGMLPEYARVPENLDLIITPATAWATVQDPYENYQYLEQRRLLTARSNADAPLLAAVDVTPPPIYREMIWGDDKPQAWALPRIQPEQLRLATYAALAAGHRGIVFGAGDDLTQSTGRMATIEMALLNEEIDLFEPILADPDKSIRMLNTYLPDPPPPPPMSLFAMNNSFGTRAPTPKEFPPNPTVWAAAITTKDRRGTLMMVGDYFKYAQYQPPQLATNNLKLLIPGPSDALAYLISPGGVRNIDSVRRPGGHLITLTDFGVSAIVLLTTNVELKDQIERAVNANRPVAVNLAIEQAELERSWVAEIDYQLRLGGHEQKHWSDLIAAADVYIKSAHDALEREDYRTAWEEARRAARPLRILMRYHFMATYDGIAKLLRDEDQLCGPLVLEGLKKPKPRLIAPIVAAPLASFSTLPQAWLWSEWMKTGKLGPNLVPSGHFNVAAVTELAEAGWSEDSYRTDDLTTEVTLKAKGGADEGGPDKTGSNLVLIAKPRKGLTVDELAPFVDHPVVALRSPSIPVREREVYRISVMAYIDHASTPGAGGVIVRDNYGGERLQFRTHQALAMDWFEVVFYRRIPADGKLSVTLGLAGYGFVAFDDFKIEPIVDQVSAEERLRLIRPRRRSSTPTPDTPDGAEKPAATPPRTAIRIRPVPTRE